MPPAAWISLIIIVVIIFLLALRLQRFLIKRAICTVVNIFRQHHATRFEEARSLEAMGLKHKFFALRLLRDFKPWALQTLISNNIVRNAIGDMYYLSEDTLQASNVPLICQVKQQLNKAKA